MVGGKAGKGTTDKSAKKSGQSLAEYQAAAEETDRTPADIEDSVLVAVLGILGEAGDLSTLFKKSLRDGEGYTVFREQFKEELGDILWYVSLLAGKLGFTLDEVAEKNLSKVNARWKGFDRTVRERKPFDAAFPKIERLPRRFDIQFHESKKKGRTVVTLTRDGVICGDTLSDNAHVENGYRFHDVFHLGYAAVLGWSPVTRKILRCKRRSKTAIDEIEDGGRASVIEEAIAALVFEYASKHNALEQVGTLDSDFLALIRRLTVGFEVHVATEGEWEMAILQGYETFRLLNRHRSGIVTVDLDERKLKFRRA